jgi:hypothetical protein
LPNGLTMARLPKTLALADRFDVAREPRGAPIFLHGFL